MGITFVLKSFQKSYFAVAVWLVLSNVLFILITAEFCVKILSLYSSQLAVEQSNKAPCELPKRPNYNNQRKVTRRTSTSRLSVKLPVTLQMNHKLMKMMTDREISRSLQHKLSAQWCPRRLQWWTVLPIA